MAIPQLTFDQESHVYRLDGVAIPGVTDVIKAAGLMGPDVQFYTERGRTRGSYVAEATALDDCGTLDWSTVDPEIEPYIRQWQAFRQQSGFTAKKDDIERRVCCPTYRYAGTLDRIGLLNGKLALIDIKLGSRSPWHVLQLSSYRRAAGTRAELVNVYLHPKRFRVESRTDRNAEAVFLSALAIFNWKQLNGVA